MLDFMDGIRPPWFLGMIHLGPLPGSPRFSGDFDAVLRAAVEDLDALFKGGADGAVVENFGDAPFHPDSVPPVTVAAMTAAAALLKAHAPERFILGLNVLRNDAAAAVSIASVTEIPFVRVNVHTGAVLSDQGILTGRADETMRLRASLGRPVALFADIRVKHAVPIVTRAIEDEARDTVERGLADALLVTGPRTGASVDREELIAVRRAVAGTPVLAASGVTPEQAYALAPHCDGFIAGTWLKQNGRIDRAVDVDRVRQVAQAIASGRR